MLYTHIPAHDPDAEATALGALIMAPAQVQWFAANLSGGDFANATFGAVFEALAHAMNPGEHMDLCEIALVLRQTPDTTTRRPSLLDALGWWRFIGAIDAAPLPEDEKEAARQVRLMAEFRRKWPESLTTSDWMCAVPDVSFAAYILCSDKFARRQGYITLGGAAMPVIDSRTVHMEEAWDAYFNHKGTVPAEILAAKVGKLTTGLAALTKADAEAAARSDQAS